MKTLSKNTSKGFTLIEVLITIAIVAIFASIAIPSFSKMIKSNRISTVTNELVGNLVFTRSEALKRSNNITLCASSDQSSCNETNFGKGWVVFLDCDENGARATGTVSGCGPNDAEEIIKVSDGFEDVYIDNPTASGDVTFKFSGRVDVSVFRVGSGTDASDLKKKVVLSKIGRMRVGDL